MQETREEPINPKNFIIGIVGMGFVGSAVAFGLSPLCEVRCWDIKPELCTHNYNDLLECDFVFICVPTPTGENGHNLSYVHAALQTLEDKKYAGLVIIKSTMVPGSTTKLQEVYSRLGIVYCPEFLTARTAKLDFMNPNRVILGIRKPGSQGHYQYQVGNLSRLFRERFKFCPMILTYYETAEFIKCMTNNFFAVKVSFMNEMKQIALKSGVNWTQAVEGFISDQRVANSHIDVPGPDGKLGFGGACLPKDLQAMIRLAELNGINTWMLTGAEAVNNKVRNKDLEFIKV